MEGILCDGTTMQDDFSTESARINPQVQYKNPGNWHFFTKVTRVISITAKYYVGKDLYELTVDRASHTSRLLINGQSEAERKRQNATAQEEVEDEPTKSSPSLNRPSTAGSVASGGASPSTGSGARDLEESAYDRQAREQRAAQQRREEEAAKHAALMAQVQQTRQGVERQFASNKSGADFATNVSNLVKAANSKLPLQQEMERENAVRNARLDAEFRLRQQEAAKAKELAKESRRQTLIAYVQTLTDKATSGDDAAMLQLGLYNKFYLLDDAAALKWLTLAAESGNRVAMGRLGDYYAKAVRSPRDPQSLQWYEKGAAKYDVYSLFHLGRFYFNLYGVDTIAMKKSLGYLHDVAAFEYKIYDDADEFVFEANQGAERRCYRYNNYYIEDVPADCDFSIASNYMLLAEHGASTQKNARLEKGKEWFEKLRSYCTEVLARPGLASYRRKYFETYKKLAETKLSKIEKSLRKAK
ncbi:hypothetical protein JAO73_10395 [Hymenobacter sp. BT523]|uniref:hypothetical protein n=1 Tax=Hymenobacter sp. BT523 TaxID=2795725 RepID=UPI0018EC0E10|nr:hypothetical protein [Hymenobacter sp. BT523]MBJ6109424.1 hypothetical protein [Hymenobacter sp. BT523]